MWAFLGLNNIKVIDLFNNSNLKIDFNKKMYAIDGNIGSDVLELLDLVYQEKDLYHSINKFFKEIGEKNFVSFNSLKAYNEIIGLNSYFLSYIAPSLNLDYKTNSFKMPKISDLYDEFSYDIIKKYKFIFPELPIYEGSLIYLHIDASSIIQGVTIKSKSGFITTPAPYTTRITPCNFNNLKEKIFNGKQIKLSINKVFEDSIGIFVGAKPSVYDFSNTESVLDVKYKKHDDLNYLFQTDAPLFASIKIDGKPLSKHVFDIIKAHKGWQAKINEIEDVIVNMSNDDFFRLINLYISVIVFKT